MAKIFGKALRISLIVAFAVIMSFAVLSLLLGIAKTVLLFFTEGTYFEGLSLISIVGFFPICALCVLISTVIYIQLLSTRRIEKLVLKADNIPNDYSFEAPQYKKSKLKIFVKVVLFIAVGLLFAICALMICYFMSSFLIDMWKLIYDLVLLISAGKSTSWHEIASVIINVIDILRALSYTMIFFAIEVCCILGALSIFVGGSGRQADELALVLNQKSQFAKIRKMEENDEVDEISQLF